MMASSKIAEKKAKGKAVANDDEWQWIGAPMNKELAQTTYPHRKTGSVAPAGYDPFSFAPPECNTEFIARNHYTGVCDSDGVEIRVGDFVELGGDKFNFYMRVRELFVDVAGQQMFDGIWFYTKDETVMANDVDGNKIIEVDQDERRLFVATEEDNASYLTVQPLNTIQQRVDIKQVKPGAPPPSAEECDFWYDQTHSRKFFTFKDVIEESDLDGEEEACAAGSSNNSNKKVLRVLELCSGVGGLGFLCQDGQMNGVDVSIKPSWAVDFDEAACVCYQINHPKTHVFCQGIDEVLMLSKIWALEVIPTWTQSKGKRTAPKGATDVLEVLEVRLRENAHRGNKGQGKDQLMSRLKREHCWLEYSCMYKDKTARWVRDSAMLPCDAEMEAFVRICCQNSRIPIPGEVDMIMGGPPCQGLSGLNRNAKQADILNDPKNRLIRTYYDMVGWFTPKYTLTEQVLDMFKKENGRYARFVAASLTALRYQCRIGIIAAGDHGCPQGRYRTITWGASAGNVLPAFPEPSHQCMFFHTAVPRVAHECCVGFLSDESQAAAYPMTVIGDILDDLPSISNFCMSDSSDYACAPTRPYQVYMRRAPPAGDPSLEDRQQAANNLMRGHSNKELIRLIQLYSEKGSAALGYEFFCQKSVIFKNSNVKVEEVDPLASDGVDDIVADDDDEVSSSRGSSSGSDDDTDKVDHDAVGPSRPHKGKAAVKGGAAAAAKAAVSGETGSKGKAIAKGGAVAAEVVAAASLLVSKKAGLKGKAAAVAAVAAGKKDSSKGVKKRSSGGRRGKKGGAAGGDDDDEDEDGGPAPDLKREANYVAETWEAFQKQFKKSRQIANMKDRMSTRHAFAENLGQMVYKEIVLATQRTNPGPLRDHRSLQCNADDFMRMVNVPKHKNACFRDMAGVVENTDGTCCAGHCHAFITEKSGSDCLGGGTTLAAKHSLHKDSRVDLHDRGGWRGAQLEGCPSRTEWLPTADILCPRWCVTYQKGKSGRNGSRQSCFGRVWYDEIQPTVVTRAEPHNLKIVHPTEDRVLSIREMARSQGFPDYWVLVGIDASSSRSHTSSVPTRYRQMGNAVAPPMARALGRCLIAAVVSVRNKVSSGHIEEPAILKVPDPEMLQAYEEASSLGLIPYSVEHKLWGGRPVVKRKASAGPQDKEAKAEKAAKASKKRERS